MPVAIVAFGAILALGQVLDLVDQCSGALTEAVFSTFVDRLVAERSGIQYRLDVTGQRVALGR